MVATYTQRFSEEWALVGRIANASISSETNLTARLDVSDFVRLAVLIETDGAEILGVDFEQANALSGGTLKMLDAGSKDVDYAAEAGLHLVEIRSEEFDTNPGIESVETFKWLNVELTPAGAMRAGVTILGLPKSQPPTSNWTSVTD